MKDNQKQNQKNNHNQRNNNTNHQHLPQFNPNWIKNAADNDMIEYCKKLGHLLKSNNISSSQLRNIYGEVIRIRMKGYETMKEDFLLLKPKLYYNASRNNSIFFKNFIEKSIEPAMDQVKDSKTLENFHNYLEAILAYHKYYGGK